jgi:hypothetical protein
MNELLKQQLDSLQDTVNAVTAQKKEAETRLISISNLLKGVMANG